MESARMPEIGEVRRAKKEVEEVIRDWSATVVGRPRDVSNAMRVEEIIPVLQSVLDACAKHMYYIPEAALL